MPINLPSREELLAQVRKKSQEMQAGRRDPDQFSPPKAQKDETIEYIFRVLPPLRKDEKYRGGGTVKEDADIWYYENGTHYINNERYSCPRIHDHQECPLCKLGFDIIADSDNDEFRRKIIRNYIATSYWAMNIYFPNTKKNPEAVRGKVFWYNASQTVFKMMEKCILSDDAGDADDPKACGIFYHPLEGYNYKLVVQHKGSTKGGDSFNSYEASAFIANSLSPLVKDESGAADEDEIQKVLDQRLWLPMKFKERDAGKLLGLVNKINMAKTGDDTEIITGQDTEKSGKSGNVGDEIVQEGLVKGGANGSKPKPPVPAPVKQEQKPVKPAQKKPVVDDDDAEGPPWDAKSDRKEAGETKTPTKIDEDNDPVLADLLAGFKKK